MNVARRAKGSVAQLYQIKDFHAVKGFDPLSFHVYLMKIIKGNKFNEKVHIYAVNHLNYSASNQTRYFYRRHFSIALFQLTDPFLLVSIILFSV